MNILIDRLPSSVEVGGRLYAIDTSYTTSIRFENLMLDDTIDGRHKLLLALNLYFPDIPKDTARALKAVQTFYACDRSGPNRSSRSAGEAIFSFDYDAPYIYAAFRSQYGIDLQQEQNMHWWVFRALMESLDESTLFVKILEYRATDTKKMKGEQRKYYEKLKRLYALPKPRSEQEKEDAIAKALLDGGDFSKIIENTP